MAILAHGHLGLPPEALGGLLVITSAEATVLIGHVDRVVGYNLPHSNLVRLHGLLASVLCIRALVKCQTLSLVGRGLVHLYLDWQPYSLDLVV